MNLFTRITATIGATAEKTISRVENHDAIVEAAIRDTRKAASQAKVRYSRVVRDGQVMKKRLAEAREMERKWTERAADCASDNQKKALACLQRRNECRSTIEQLSADLQQHEVHEQKLTASIKTIENRLQQITQQRNQMRSRESTAKALEVISRVDDDAGYGVDDAFDRWSMNISETEMTVGEVPVCDALEFEFESSEQEIALTAELEELVALRQEKDND